MATAATLFRQARHLAKFARLFAHLESALAITDLATVDPQAAAAKADECRKLTAGVLARD